ncbi:MAG TPA: tRNA pseudouridine(38-40) synthase TruA [candidate division Zixibacteria bacterium]|nr:tRNA pseudouridine(38-40) synthase TruA [candidate division Zixibacteria bacterium]MDD4917865.1 tRNA pseudouridine(38-40) synthase TruA [candidate division Zixibacteria bacterium]MDM7973523.1 tRNA pseudouridine(38-40) synthase TruA [candidate division Zixibacteria bacterium]HOD67457.1 tRNA pseudouridine(38-40) synthase TruA [candidate division Zixibacteria bacterium]HOZ07064.1 tRNA pseudouridine(38-40) synthase TruA [candidate division Zixibacteria bacterium]
MAERNIRLTLEYKGTAYAGWQIQAGQPTVQGELVAAIRKTTGCDVSVHGAGRTDAGVHALGQVANFRIDHRLAPDRYRDALNYYLPADIRIREAAEAPLSFHARRSAKAKRYRYVIAGERSALWREYRWELAGREAAGASPEAAGVLPPADSLAGPGPGDSPAAPAPALRFDLLQQAAALIVGEHDFAPFCVTASRKEDNRCRIDRAHWYRVGPLRVFEIRGNRFLHNMVRSLVGAMVNLAAESPDRHPDNLTLTRFADIIQAPNQQRIVFTAPARGLYLVSVHY